MKKKLLTILLSVFMMVGTFTTNVFGESNVYNFKQIYCKEASGDVTPGSDNKDNYSAYLIAYDGDIDDLYTYIESNGLTGIISESKHLFSFYMYNSSFEQYVVNETGTIEKDKFSGKKPYVIVFYGIGGSTTEYCAISANEAELSLGYLFFDDSDGDCKTNGWKTLSAPEPGTKANPWEIGAEGNESNVKAWLTEVTPATDPKTYTLTISGSGDMCNYSGNNAPWKSFYDSITSVVIEEGVSNIGNKLFSNCRSLTNITLPDSLLSIGEYVFQDCNNLASITIPKNVETIGVGLFTGCNNLESITVADGNKNYHSNGNCLIDTKQKKLIAGCKDSIIPSDGSVTTIGDYAFNRCKGLETVIIPENIEVIGNSFSGCSGVKTFILKTTTPPEISYDDFSLFFSNVPIFYFPSESIEEYTSNSINWADFISDFGVVCKKLYFVNIDEAEHGKVTVDKDFVLEDAVDKAITVNVTPNEGYILKSLYYYTTDPTVATDIMATKSITMPTPMTNVTIKAEFEKQVTVADILDKAEDNFPTVQDGGWVNANGKKIYVNGNILTVTYNVPLESALQKDGDNYKYIDGSRNCTFVMTSGKLTKIIVSGAIFPDDNGEYVPQTNYVITDGKHATININGNKDVIFKSNADFSKFVRVEVDNTIVDPSNYEVAQGSTKVTMKAAYLSNLASGEHTLTIVSKDGKASTTFTITKASKPSLTPYIPPKTGVR